MRAQPNTRNRRPKRRALFPSIAALALTAACGDEQAADNPPRPPPGAGAETGDVAPSVFVTTNLEGRDADALLSFGPDLGAPLARQGEIGGVAGIQSIAVGPLLEGYVTYDRVGGGGGLMVVPGLGDGLTMNEEASLGEGRARVEGPRTGLVAPKGVEFVPSLSQVLVADHGAKDVKAFGADASGDVAPALVVSDLRGEAPWDVEFDVAGDRLYVATTGGRVLVYDAFSTRRGQGGPSRSFVPAIEGQKASVNLHGIRLVRSLNPLLAPDVLVLSDVGDAASGSDGQIFTIADPATADGEVELRARVAGPASRLGNPVDLAVDLTPATGPSLYVAEKSNDAVLRFDGIATLTGERSSAPDASIDVPKAESVALAGAGGVAKLLAASNPSGRDLDGVLRLPLDLRDVEVTYGELGDVQSVQSVALAASGDAYVSYDRAGGRGGVLVVSSLAARVEDGVLGGGVRRIRGEATGLVAPKGLVVAEKLSAIVVADVGARDIKGFDERAEGNASPAFVVADLGGDRAAWDLDYDGGSDRLYAAATDGVVLVFDRFSTRRGEGGPDRTITPSAGGTKVSVNLHGIRYVAGDDLLVLTDVGKAEDATDGQLFTVDGASFADGATDVRLRIGGPASVLGNPVDVALLGGSAIVAEKANGRLLRFDGVLSGTGSRAEPPDASTLVAKPESVFALP